MSLVDDNLQTLRKLVQEHPLLSTQGLADAITARAYATLSSLDALRQELAADLARRGEEEIAARRELREEIGELRAEVQALRQTLGELRTQTTADIDELNDRISDLSQPGDASPRVNGA